MSRYLILVCILISLVLILAGATHLSLQFPDDSTAPSPESERERGGIWIEALAEEPETLDPAHISAREERQVAALLYSGLVRIDERGLISGDLAHTHSLSPDGLQYTFHLRRDVHFSNGRPLSADDVAFSLRRILHPATESPHAPLFEDIVGARDYAAGSSNDVAGITTQDDYTVVITLERPRPTFLYVLATPIAYILDRKTTRDYETPASAGVEGGHPGFHPVGTGPFHLHRFRAGDHMRLVRNEVYHGTTPPLDAIHFRTDLDREEAWELFGSGGLTAARIPPHLTAPPGGAVYTLPTGTVSVISLCPEDTMTADIRVREAVQLGLDIDSVLQSALPGDQQAATGFTPPGIPGHSRRLELVGHDPERAMDLLREAGYPHGIGLTLGHMDAEWARDIAQKIAENLETCSMEVQLHRLTGNGNELPDNDVPQLLYRELSGLYPDPEGYLYPLAHSSLQRGPRFCAHDLSSPQLDALLETCSHIMCDVARMARLQEVEALLIAQALALPVHYPQVCLVVQPFVRGLEPAVLPEGSKYESVWFERRR